MAKCMICGENLPEHSQTCSICGSRQPESLPGLRVATVVTPPATTAPQSIAPNEPLPPNSRLCPGCGKVFGPEYADAFCTCGMELVMIAPVAADESSALPRGESRPKNPAPGTPCLVLYGADKLPIHIQYHGNPMRFRNIWIREVKPIEGKKPQ